MPPYYYIALDFFHVWAIFGKKKFQRSNQIGQKKKANKEEYFQKIN